MGLAKHKKLSKSEYDSLSTKDEDTIYAVNENGDFSEENLDDTAELFIGDKKITNDIPYGECNVSPSTVEKQVTTLNGNFKLKQGAKVSVKFLQGHTAATMTLNVDGTGAKNVYRDGNSPKSSMIKAYNVYEFVYDGTYWRITGVDTDTTYEPATSTTDGLMSSEDKVKLDAVEDTYLPLTGGVITGSLETKGLTHLSNYLNGKLQVMPNAVVNSAYSSALGYSSKAGLSTGDPSYPYQYITTVQTLPFTIIDDNLYGVSLAKGDSTTYTYNGEDYTVTNPHSTNHASVFLIEDTDGLFLKGTSYPNNICNIFYNTYKIPNGRILSSRNIIDNVYEIIVNQQNTTLHSYLTATTLYMFKKTTSSNYNGYSSVASGYSSVASGYSSVASGNYSVASGNSSVASGNYSVASGNYSVASGNYSVASGDSSVASGNSSVASGNYSVASGYSSVASGNSSVASGYSSVASGNYSVALNARTNAKGVYQTVVGYYNADVNNAYFIVGNGSSDTNRSNAFTVSKNGHTTTNRLNILGSTKQGTGYLYSDTTSSVYIGVNGKIPFVIDGASNVIRSSSVIPNTISLGSSAVPWKEVYATIFKGALQGNANTATKVNNALTIKNGDVIDTFDGSAAKTIDITNGEINLVEFDEYIDNDIFTQVQIGTAANFDGVVYFIANAAVGSDPQTDKRKPIFAYKQGDNYYTSNTTGYLEEYVTQGDDGSFYIRQDRLFSYNGQIYIFNGEQLLPISQINKMPVFDGIVDTATISTNQPYSNGTIIYVRDAATFVNYYDGTYYRDWSKQDVFIAKATKTPHTDRIFWFRNLPYIFAGGKLGRFSITDA